MISDCRKRKNGCQKNLTAVFLFLSMGVSFQKNGDEKIPGMISY